jgi:hypothetical protein
MKGWDVLGGLVCMAVACGGDTVHLGTSTMSGSGSDSGGPGSRSDDGATSIASLIQETPTNLVSDGTTLFWISSVGTGGALSSMSVNGGPITTVLPAPVSGGYLFVDDVNVYYPGQSGGIYRAPKGGGGAPTLVNEAGALVGGVTVLGGSAYWVEEGGSIGRENAVKSAPLQGGPVSTIAELSAVPPGGSIDIGVTTTTVFLSWPTGPSLLTSFPISGVPDGGMPAPVPGAMQECQSLLSDTDAVYYGTASSLYRVASDGTTTLLGAVVEDGLIGGAIAFDDTYVYWLDIATVGTIMRVPKTGGTATIIARDTSPVAIAVDANAVYWSDVGGFIMRLAK